MIFPPDKNVTTLSTAPDRPVVWLVGRTDHADFREAVALLQAEVKLDAINAPPELIVIAQDRPGAIDQREVERLRREAPLAGIVSLVGSWCEGELRTGRPLVGVTRLYWYEFVPWWRRQMARRADGLCPEWSVSGDFGLRHPGGTRNCGLKNDVFSSFGVVMIAVPRWETADTIADVLQRAGYATIWQPPAKSGILARGVTAGIWEGGQLEEHEAAELHRFCEQLARDAAPVMALLDFPRRDRCDLAMSAGAAAVLGKPWLNDDALATLADVIQFRDSGRGAIRPARAA
ncbi:MAG: hypothetical protein WD669_04990 [Pirellulales bacterium]